MLDVNEKLIDLFLVIQDAIERGSPPDITSACGGDAELERELRQALAVHAVCTQLTTDNGGPSARPTLLSERYELSWPVETGGMGEVWRGWDRLLKREVALKIPLALPHNYSAVDRQRREARMLAALGHGAIVPVHDLCKLADERTCMVMAYIHGRTLREELEQRRDGRIDEPRFLEYFETICRAVAKAHQQSPPVLHLDLKPSNIMVTPDHEVFVLDWGIARFSEQEKDDARPRSDPATSGSPESGLETKAISGAASVWNTSIKGTRGFMPPEQLRGQREAVGTSSDVFSLGGLLSEVLGGTQPYERETPAESVPEALAATIRRLESQSADEELVEIVRRCLAYSPDERPRDAGELLRLFIAAREAIDLRLRDAEKNRVAAEARVAAEEARAVEALQRANAERLHADSERRRRTWQVGSLVVVVLLLVVGLTQVGRERNAANASARREQVARDKNFEVIEDLLTRVATRDYAKIPGLQSEQRDLLLKAREFCEQALSVKSNDARALREAAIACRLAANIESQLGNREAAADAFERSAELLKRLRNLPGRRTSAMFLLGLTYNDHASLCQAAGDNERTKSLLDEAEQCVEEIIRPDSGQSVLRLKVKILTNQAKLASEHNDHETALKHLQSAARIADEFSRDAAMDALRIDLKLMIGWRYCNLGQRRAAQLLNAEIQTLLDAVDKRDRGSAQLRRLQAGVYEQSGALILTADRPTKATWADALVKFRQEYGLRKELARENPLLVDDRVAAMRSLANVTLCARKCEQAELANRAFEEARLLAIELMNRYPDDVDALITVGNFCNNQAKALTEQYGDHDEAIETVGLAMRCLNAVLSRDPNHYEGRRYLSAAYGIRAEAKLRIGQAEDSIQDFTDAIPHAPDGLRIAYSVSRAFCRAKSGRHSESWAEAELVMSKAIENGNGAVLVNLAITCQLCANAAAADETLDAEQKAMLAERYQAGAIRALGHCTRPEDVAFILKSSELSKVLARPDCPSHLRLPRN